MIDSDYQSRLAAPGLNGIDRQRLMDEYLARRATAPVQYRVTFIRPASCRTLPAEVVLKTLDDILLTWANDSEFKRGVLKQRVKVLTPSILDVAAVGQQNLFVRATLIWSNVDRIIRNMAEVEALPGAELVRFGDQQVSLAEIRARMEDLQHTHLEALMALVGADEDRSDSIDWLSGALTTVTSQQQAAQARATANLDALREYSGVMPQPNPARGELQRSPGGTDVQSLSPQIDRTFIDRILEMSETNTTFRQELTRSMVKAQLEAVEHKSAVDHYKQLLGTLKTNDRVMSATELQKRLLEIVSESKKWTAAFNGLYDEWSRSAFRPAPALYRTERPGAVRITRPFSLATYEKAVALVLFATLILAVLAALMHTHLWPTIAANK